MKMGLKYNTYFVSHPNPKYLPSLPNRRNLCTNEQFPRKKYFQKILQHPSSPPDLHPFFLPKPTPLTGKL